MLYLLLFLFLLFILFSNSTEFFDNSDFDKKNGCPCISNGQCKSQYCINNICSKCSPINSPCKGTNECCGNLLCDNKKCIENPCKKVGQSCSKNTDCCDNHCLLGVCFLT